MTFEPPHAYELLIPFDSSNLLTLQPVLIVDTESTENQQIVCVGIYPWGTPNIRIVVFLHPVDPEVVQTLPIWQQYTDYRYAIYNTVHEIALLSLPPSRCIELMAAPYLMKEKYIAIGPLDAISGRHLNPYTPEKLPLYIYHNLSCVLKECVLFLGQSTYGRISLKEEVMKQIHALLMTPRSNAEEAR
jgi:hypothetical protein